MSDRAPSAFHRLLRPERVAIIGSTSKDSGFGSRTRRHLEGAKFAGEVLVVQRASDIDEPVDVAIVAVPSAVVPVVLTELDGRAAHAIVYTAGFGEVGVEGLGAFHTDSLGLLGPNSVGLYYAPSRAALTFAAAFDEMLDCPAGSGVFMISHSGAFGVRVARAAARRGLAPDGFVGTGNEDGYQATDILHAILGDESLRPKVVTLYLEGVRDGAALVAGLASARRLGVRVVVLFGGRSRAGLDAAASHTDAVSADHRVVAELCRMHGAVVVHSDRALVDATIGLACNPVPRGRRAAVVTGSGGAGVVAADLLHDAGVEVPPLSERTRAAMAALLPSYASFVNPVDVTAQVIGDTGLVARVSRELCDSGEVDSLLVIGRVEQATDLAAALATTGCALVVATLDGDGSTTSPSVRQGIAVAPDLESGCRSVAALVAASTFDTPLNPLPNEAASPARNGRTYDVSASFAAVEKAGVRCAPYRVVDSVASAQASAVELGFPVVVKSNVSAATHKAKSGGVQLDVLESTVAATAERLLAQSETVIVARQLRGAPELFASVRRDVNFGLVVVAGLGGGFVEMIDRVVTLPAVATEAWLTNRLVDEVFGPSDASRRVARSLASITRRLVTLAEDVNASLVECNPLIEFEGDLIALDARILTNETESDV